ncbi:MAG: hypothetical protein CSA97_00300 [Bacteroidetes bacterium]|nr:MAG: hypothetical protein CSA97_00300 [Bacteroidota bacterium]
MYIGAPKAAQTYTVDFVIDPADTDKGEIVGDVHQVVKKDGNARQVNVMPKDGYRFSGWEIVDDKGANMNISLASALLDVMGVTEDVELKATFIPDYLNLVVFTVLDPSGKGIEGAKVTMAGVEKMTNSQGQATFDVKDKIQIGLLKVVVEKDGYLTHTIKQYKVNSSESLYPSITLTYPVQDNYLLVVKAQDAEQLFDMEGVTLKLSSAAMPEKTYTTDANGAKTISIPATGEYTLVAEKDGFKRQTHTLTYEPPKQLLDSEGKPMVDEEGNPIYEKPEETKYLKLEMEPNMPQTYRVAFTVSNIKGEALQDVAVEFNSVSKMTNADGTAVFEGLEKGQYGYAISFAGYVSQQGDYMLSSDMAEPVTLVKELSFTVVVKDKLNDAALQGAEVFFGDKSKLTDADGKAVFTVEEGEEILRVRANGYAEASKTIVVDQDSNEQIISLSLLHDVTFMVTDLNGVALPDAHVAIAGGTEKSTDVNGSAIFELGAGEHSYTITRNGYVAAKGSVNVESNGQNVSIKLSRACQLAFEVYAQGEALANALITLAGMEQMTNAEGRASFSDIPEGSHTYTVAYEGYMTVEKVVELPLSASKPEHVVLKPVKTEEPNGGETEPKDDPEDGDNTVEDKPTDVAVDALAEVKVMPTLFSDYLLVEHADKVVSYRLLSLQGVAVRLGAAEGLEQLRIETLGLPEGFYILQLVDAEGQQRAFRLVKR